MSSKYIQQSASFLIIYRCRVLVPYGRRDSLNSFNCVAHMLKRQALVKVNGGPVELRKVLMINSVFCPPKLRGNGLATEMLLNLLPPQTVGELGLKSILNPAFAKVVAHDCDYREESSQSMLLYAVINADRSTVEDAIFFGWSGTNLFKRSCRRLAFNEHALFFQLTDDREADWQANFASTKVVDADTSAVRLLTIGDVEEVIHTYAAHIKESMENSSTPGQFSLLPTCMISHYNDRPSPILIILR